jgi:hypothetical protein
MPDGKIIVKDGRYILTLPDSDKTVFSPETTGRTASPYLKFPENPKERNLKSFLIGNTKYFRDLDTDDIFHEDMSPVRMSEYNDILKLLR